MRDDIHRKLPLSPTWRRVVRACARAAEAGERAPRLAYAAATELRNLSRPLVESAGRMSQPEFFGRTDRALVAMAATPIDHAFVRELAACKEGDRVRAVRSAVQGALAAQLEATQREIRAHATIADPRSWRTLMDRVEAAAHQANTTKVVDDYLRGEPPPPRYRRVLDLDADLRGHQ